jgi:hypothetical protein
MARLARDRGSDRFVFDVIYVNIVPLLVWVLAASIVLLMRREETATTAA